MERWLTMLGDLATTYGVRIIGVLIVLWITVKLANWMQVKITSTLQKRRFDTTLSIFFGKLARWGLIIAAVLACLGVFGIETTSFAAVIGAAGLAVGLAFQGTLSNFAAGVMLLVFRPFKVGDYIKVSGVEGVVKEIGLFTIALDTLQNHRLVLPNSAVAGQQLDNVTFHEYRRVDIDVGVEYSADIDRTREVLDAALAALPCRNPEWGHQVFLVGLGGSSVDWQVSMWTKPEDYWLVYESLIRAVKYALDDAGIGIPFPQMDVHLDQIQAA